MKIMLIIIISAVVLFSLFSHMAYASNRKTERQKYEVVKKENGFEIRFYPRVIMASVTSEKQGEKMNANGNFRRLAGYIFGGNKADKKIAMTAPVHMEQDTNANRMSFVVPAGYSMTDLPDPNDTGIRFHYSEEGYYAALSFGGFAGDHKIKEKEQELKKLLTKAGITTTGNYSYLGYNAPWEVIGRENDIIVKVEYTK